MTGINPKLVCRVHGERPDGPSEFFFHNVHRSECISGDEIFPQDV